jgi:hypothetical protein
MHFSMETETGFFIQQGIISAVKSVKFITDMTYMILRGCWCDIIILNVCDPTENKSDDTKNSFYKELKHVLINS